MVVIWWIVDFYSCVNMHPCIPSETHTEEVAICCHQADFQPHMWLASMHVYSISLIEENVKLAKINASTVFLFTLKF